MLIRTRFYTVMIFCIILGLSAAIFVNYALFKNEIVKMLRMREEFVVREIKNDIDGRIFIVHQAIESMKFNEDAALCLDSTQSGAAGAEALHRIKSVMRSIQNVMHFAAEIALIDDKGDILVSAGEKSGNVKETDYFKEAIAGFFTYSNANGGYNNPSTSITLAGPIRKRSPDSDASGVIAVTVNIQDFLRYETKIRFSFSEENTLFMLDGKGKVFMRMGPEGAVRDESVFRTLFPTIRDYEQGSDKDLGSGILFSSALSNIRMRLVSYVPGSSFYGPLKDFRNISLIVYALALIFSAAGSNFLARSIIPRLRSGAAFAEAVVSGDISGHLDDSGSDEISGMFRAVNIMIDHLRKAIDTAKFQEKKALEASDELFMQNSLLEMTVEERTAELEQAEKHTRLILDMTTEAIFELDNKNMISFANSTALKMLGMDEPSVINRGFFDEALLETAQGSDGADNLIAAVESGEKKNLYNLWITTKNGGRIPVSISVSPIHRYDSRIGTIIAIIDLTEAIRAGKMIEALYESTEESYMFFSETFEPIDCNPAFVKLMKAQSKFQALEEFSSFFPPFQESGAASDQFFREITAKVRKDGGARFEWTLQDINGRVIPCLATMSLVEVNQQRINIASIHDLSGQKNAEKALTRQREQLQEILDSSPTSMMIIGDGVVRKINDNGIAMLGLRMGDSPQKMYVDSDQRKKMLAAIDIGELVKNWPVQMYSAGREILDTLASLHPFVYEGRASLLAWISDVTELTQAKILAEAAAEAKSDFLASMSHEIRTPMNAIIGLTHLCMQTNPNEKQANYLVKIQKAANVLLSIINDILDFSKIESGKFTLDSTPFRLREITKSLWDMIAFKAEEKGVKFSMNISPDIPEAFLGDPLRLSQVLINLCNNSIKFTEKGRIELDVSSSEIAEPVGELQIAELRFSVTDTGIGLTEEQSRKLFKPFTQADSSITRKYGGSGLGLSISKHLVESMDGRIWVESVFGEGSKFSFTVKLPVASSYEELKTANSKSEEETTGDADGEILPAPARVLLVEDNEINQEIAVELLTQFGATVDVAPNGAESIIMLGSSDYDIVFMDVQMPVMDGLEATRRIRTVMRYSKDDLPIIAMTAHAMKGDYEKSVAAGMNDHITKPIDPDRLYRTLKKWARPKRQENAG